MIYKVNLHLVFLTDYHTTYQINTEGHLLIHNTCYVWSKYSLIFSDGPNLKSSDLPSLFPDGFNIKSSALPSLFSDGFNFKSSDLPSLFPDCLTLSQLFYPLYFQTGLTLSHLIYHLAHNQEKQEKLYQELKAEVTADQPISPEVLEDGLMYLKATVKESQRLDSVSSHSRGNSEIV